MAITDFEYTLNKTNDIVLAALDNELRTALNRVTGVSQRGTTLIVHVVDAVDGDRDLIDGVIDAHDAANAQAPETDRDVIEDDLALLRGGATTAVMREIMTRILERELDELG